MGADVEQLVARYRTVYAERFQGLPIVNPLLEVEAVGFRSLDEHAIGALITPWFINLVLLPGSDHWEARAQGSTCSVGLPGGNIDFTVAHDDVVGTMLSAALFSSVADFPGQALAREVALETLRLLFGKSPAAEPEQAQAISRRELFRRLGGTGGANE